MKIPVIILLCFLFSLAQGQFDLHWVDGRNTIVQFFQWKWSDIARECENFLGPKGFAGIQIPPPHENIAVPWNPNNRPWWERYQPISYKLTTRSGNENDLADMIRRCNNVGVRTYADVVFNHMTNIEGRGTGGSEFDIKTFTYPGVPYGPEHFNEFCSMSTWDDPATVRNCRLEGMPDINQANSHVQNMIVNAMNKLIDLGAAGFRVDAAKHMWPKDLEAIFKRLKNLNTAHGFASGSKPFIVLEVIDDGRGVSKNDYVHLGTITEFQYTQKLGQAFRGHGSVADLGSIPHWGMLESRLAFTSVDNHDSERRGPPTTTYKEPRYYRSATVFHLAFPYGIPRMLSSYDWSFYDQGPPADSNHNIKAPTYDSNGQCNNGWVCQHRWRPMWSMVKFRNVVKGTKLENWWNQGANQVAFSRGNRGFVVFNAENWDLNATIKTGLPSGRYCDVISGEKSGSSCTGKTIDVNNDGYANFNIPGSGDNGAIAIHVESRL